tara:strand:+ start:71 stop:274 length:204 start_codon:yes stop_codon:yes gene_type:complete
MSEKKILIEEMYTLSNKLKVIAYKINNLEDKQKINNSKKTDIAGTIRPQNNSCNFRWQKSLRNRFSF